MKPNIKKQITTAGVIAGLFAVGVVSVRAQIGSGWSSINPNSELQVETYDTSTGKEMMTVYPGNTTSINNNGQIYSVSGGVESYSIVPASPQGHRLERHYIDDYAGAGGRQFQADVMIQSPSDGETIHQIFGLAPYILIRESSAYNGSIKVLNNSGAIATGLYGTWFTLNSINVPNVLTSVYVNGSLKWSGTPPANQIYATKYGCYGTLTVSRDEIDFKNVHLWENRSQSFSGNFEIQNEKNFFALNVSGASTANGAAIIQWPYDGNDNSKWQFIPTDSGYYKIVSVNSGKCLVVQGASTANGALLVQWSFGSSGDDQWKPVQNWDYSYTFYNRNSGKVLEDPGGNGNQGVQMDQWDRASGTKPYHQNWILISR